MKALLVGGTGPTGPHLARGLIERGYQVTLFHRGAHEPPDLPPAEHLHGDPHFRETIAAALGDRTFDLVIATYGRVRYLAEALAGRCAHFIAIGGAPVYRGLLDPTAGAPYGLRLPTAETADLCTDPGDGRNPAARFGHLIYSTEQAVFALGDRGAFQATYFRYPLIYGPRQLLPIEWSILRRIQDGRHTIIVPDHGLSITMRCAAQNAAEAVLRAVDQPARAAGQAYNCGDDDQYTLQQWIQLTAEAAGGSIETFSLPDRLATPARILIPLQPDDSHTLLDITKIRAELSYRDVIPARAALAETVAWLLANPVTPAEYPTFRDPFDYAAEDRLIAAYQAMVARLDREHPFDIPAPTHSYAHPREPGLRQGDHRGR